MDCVEAPKARTVELRRRVEERIIEAKQVQTLEHASRAREGGCALRTHCPDDLDSSKRARHSPRPPTQVTLKGARFGFTNHEFDECG